MILQCFSSGASDASESFRSIGFILVLLMFVLWFCVWLNKGRVCRFPDKFTDACLWNLKISNQKSNVDIQKVSGHIC